MLVTLPQRITSDLLQLFTEYQEDLNLKLITHFNHPQELSPETKKATKALLSTNLRIFNQSVLLKDVNNTPQILALLSKGLDQLGITPYYLHHTDLTRGTQHFRCSIDEGLRIYQALRGQISGYLIPRYVIEIPRGGGKVEVTSSAVRKGQQKDEWILTSPLDSKEYYYKDLAYKS